MSAIWGIFSPLSSIENNIDSIMTAPYKKRCRIDKYRYETLDNVYFGCGIQNIMSYSKNEVLPIFDSKNGILITADCILDNREELLELLSLHDSSTPDGTLIYHAYLKWGFDFLKHIIGIFSIAIFDKKNGTLTLATDPTASRVLNFSVYDNKVLFSTLIEPIRAISHSPVNSDYLRDYLFAPGLMPNLSARETAFENIYRMEPGSYIQFSLSALSKEDGSKIPKPVYYFDLSSKESYVDNYITNTNKKPQKIGEDFLSLYKDCVKASLCAGNKTAIALSSGLDSASVAALAAKHLAKDNATLESYTYVPHIKDSVVTSKHDNNVYDETADVQKIVSMYPNINPHYVDNHGKNCIEGLNDIIETLEMPIKAYTNLPNLCEIYDEAYKSGCRIVLTGQFGNSTVSNGLIDDVLFDLYENKHYLRFLIWLNRYSKHVKESRKKALKGCINYFKYAKEVKHKEKSFDNYKPDNIFINDDAVSLNLEKYGYSLTDRLRSSEIPSLDRIPTDSEYYHKGLLRFAPYCFIGDYETKLGLKYGIVLRDPTRDVRMLRFCYKLPYHIYGYKGTPRWLIRQNMKDYLPSKLLNNWMRYGMQNADYFERIKRDKDEVRSTIEAMLSNAFKETDGSENIKSNSFSLSELLNMDMLNHFLSSDELFTQNSNNALDYLLFCSVVSYFLEKA